MGCTDFMGMLGELAPGARANCGLSNVSNGAPEELRPILNATYLAMLLHHGIDAAIVNAFEPITVDIGRGRRPDLTCLVDRLMAGEEVPQEGLGSEAAAFVKTARVLLGQSLYSHSWLKL